MRQIIKLWNLKNYYLLYTIFFGVNVWKKNHVCVCITTAVFPSQHCYPLSTCWGIHKNSQLAFTTFTLPPPTDMKIRPRRALRWEDTSTNNTLKNNSECLAKTSSIFMKENKTLSCPWILKNFLIHSHKNNDTYSYVLFNDDNSTTFILTMKEKFHKWLMFSPQKEQLPHIRHMRPVRKKSSLLI